jgi:hypothetical protein
MGAYTAGDNPSDAEVLGFMANRAGQVFGVLGQWMMDSTPGPSNYSTTIDETRDAGVALSRACRHANALGAAADALQAAGVGDSRGATPRVLELEAQYMAALPMLEGPAKSYRTQRAITHISAGEITKAAVTSRQEQGLAVDDRTEF